MSLEIWPDNFNIKNNISLATSYFWHYGAHVPLLCRVRYGVAKHYPELQEAQ